MDYTYQFENHLREHGPSRAGQRLWWIPAVVAAVIVIADAVYLATTPSDQVSAGLAVPLLFVAAFLVLVAWAVFSIADWTYAREKYYREAQHAAACQARAYILAGRRDVAHQPPAQGRPSVDSSAR
jgi:membrane protein implicated in regulation of membrane protease activity